MIVFNIYVVFVPIRYVVTGLKLHNNEKGKQDVEPKRTPHPL